MPSFSLRRGEVEKQPGNCSGDSCSSVTRTRRELGVRGAAGDGCILNHGSRSKGGMGCESDTKCADVRFSSVGIGALHTSARGDHRGKKGASRISEKGWRLPTSGDRLPYVQYLDWEAVGSSKEPLD